MKMYHISPYIDLHFQAFFLFSSVHSGSLPCHLFAVLRCIKIAIRDLDFNKGVMR